MTDDLKAAIEHVRKHFGSPGCYPEVETTLALAEIGRLAVEASDIAFKKLSNKSGRVAAKYARNTAIDAFLAGRGK